MTVRLVPPGRCMFCESGEGYNPERVGRYAEASVEARHRELPFGMTPRPAGRNRFSLGQGILP
jgi:hypothetical protein